MANANSRGPALSPALVIGVIVVVLAAIGFYGWKTMGGGSEPEKVKVDVEQLKQDLKSGKTTFGH